jgi:hypothetical protein
MIKLYCIVLCIIFCTTINAQTVNFVSYNTIKVNGKTADTKALRHTLIQTELKYGWNDTLLRQELKINTALNRTVIINKQNNSGFLTIGGAIGNYATRIDTVYFNKEINKALIENPISNLEITEDTLTINDYFCTKVIVTDKKGYTSTYWCALDIEAPWTDNRILRDELPGLPIKMTVETDEAITEHELTEYNPEFIVGKDYFDTKNIPFGHMEQSLSNFKILTNQKNN